MTSALGRRSPGFYDVRTTVGPQTNGSSLTELTQPTDPVGQRDSVGSGNSVDGNVPQSRVCPHPRSQQSLSSLRPRVRLDDFWLAETEATDETEGDSGSGTRAVCPYKRVHEPRSPEIPAA